MENTRSSFVASLICSGILIGMFGVIILHTVADKLAISIENPYTYFLAERAEENVQSSIKEKIDNVNGVPLPDTVEEWGIEEYPFADQIQIEETEEEFGWIETVVQNIQNICERRSKTIYINKFVDEAVWNLEAVVFGSRVTNDSDLIFQLTNGYYTYNEPLLDMEKLEKKADSVYGLQLFCEEKNIPFIYINAGTKVCPVDKLLPVGMTDYTNENQDMFIDALSEKGVNYIDVRERMLADELEWYESYYITDAHWTNRNGLWLAGVIAEELNKSYGFSFDMNYFSEDSYDIYKYEKYWLGEFGKRIPLSADCMEAYDLMCPKYQTEYTYYIPASGKRYEGPYLESLFDMNLFYALGTFSEDQYLQYPGAYGCSRIRNYSNSIITNKLPTNNDGKKILFIQDSFGYYSASFLAKDISCIELLHPVMFSGSIESYIVNSMPDVVIMLYTSRELEEEHCEMYNLR